MPATRIFLTFLLASLSLLLTHSVCAQDALGSGNALDASTRLGSRGANPNARDFAAELRYRNAIITGNAPGGFSFRGRVGYTAPGEFRGSLGSDDLFNFRRDTFLSSLTSVGGQSLRSADALRFQMQLGLTGQSSLGISPIVSRSPSAGSSGFSPALTTLDPGSSLSFDPFQTRPGALRATSSFVTGDALSPTLIDARIGDDGTPTYTIASPLGSVRQQSSLTPYRSRNLLSPRDEPEGSDDTQPGTSTTDRQPGSSVLDRLRERYAQQEAAQPAAPGDTLEDRLDRIRQELQRPARPDEGLDETARDAAEALGAGGPMRVERFVDPSLDEESFFRLHMRTGQKLLGQSQWFQAEERFAAALRIKPDDPLALAGKAHAQLGAGLFRSAALSLRALFGTHPEMLSVRYDAALLPGEDRRSALIAIFREKTQGDSPHDRDAAFLLAYLGWQHERIDIMTEAFIQIDRINSELGNQEQLYEIARSLWLPAEQD